MIYNGCIDQEQTSYNRVKPNWDQLPSKVRDWCDQVALAGGAGSYSILEGCIKQELDASNIKQNFEY